MGWLEFLSAKHGSNLHSVYVRGSVAKGTDEGGISDFDGFAVVHENTPHFDEEAWASFKYELVEKHPFCTEVEGPLIRLDTLKRERDIWSRLIKTQSVCLWGESLAPDIDPLSLRDMVHYAKYARFNLETLLEEYFLEDRGRDEDMKSNCGWAARILLRAGFETTMFEQNRWSNDLYICCRSLSEAHPEKSALFFDTLNLALNPSPKEASIRKMLAGWLPWLYDEIRSKLNIESDLSY